jgi:MFS family permease
VPRWLPSIRGLPPAFWTLWVGTLINRLGGFVIPFLSLYLTRQRGVPVERVGLVVALFGLGSIAAGAVGGALADRLGRRTTLVLALVLGAAAMMQLGLAHSAVHVALATLALGFFGDMYRPAVTAAVADLVPASDRPRAYGLLYWAINLGFSIAPVLAGWIVHRGFLPLFIGDAVTSLAFAFIVWSRVPETRPPPAAGATSAAASGRSPYRHGTFMAFASIAFVTACLFQQAFVSLPVHMRAHGISPEVYGTLIAINGITIVLVQPFVVPLVQRFRPSRVLALGALLTGVGFGVAGLAHGPGIYALSILIWTLGEIVITPVTPTMVAELAPADMRGRYQGVLQMSWGAATLVGPVWGTWVLGRLGGAVLWGGCLGIGIAAAIAQLVLGVLRREPAGTISARP